MSKKINRKINREAISRLYSLLEEFLDNAPDDEEIEEMTDLDADASEVIEVYAEAQNLKTAIENAGFAS